MVTRVTLLHGFIAKVGLKALMSPKNENNLLLEGNHELKSWDLVKLGHKQ